MKANKPSYNELENQLVVLKSEVERLKLLLNQTKSKLKVTFNDIKSNEYIPSNFDLNESVFNKLKTPLNTVFGLSKLLISDKLDVEEKNNLAKIIANSSNEIQGIFSEFESYNSFVLDKNPIIKQPVSLNDLLDELKIKFIDHVFHKELSFRSIKGLSDDDANVLIDNNCITKIFSSLINNSLKFTNKGFIEIGYKLINSEINFYVKDSGVGFEKNLIEKILNESYKLESVMDESSEVGLGLSSVKQFVDLLDGTLQIKSELGVGTIFNFKVPYVPALIKSDSETTKKTIKVLIADDEEVSFTLLKKLLEKGDVQVIRAKNGEEAYEIFKKNPDINLVLMDLKMPQVDGYVAAQLIKNEAPKIPIIAQSAFTLKDDKESYKNTFDGYLSKPVNKKEFEMAVNKYLDVTLLN